MRCTQGGIESIGQSREESTTAERLVDAGRRRSFFCSYLSISRFETLLYCLFLLFSSATRAILSRLVKRANVDSLWEAASRLVELASSPGAPMNIEKRSIVSLGALLLIRIRDSSRVYYRKSYIYKTRTLDGSSLCPFTFPLVKAPKNPYLLLPSTMYRDF